MDGVLIRLDEDTTGRPGHWLGVAFMPVLSKLDTLRWYPVAQPWMGPPKDYDEPEELWRRGALQRYGAHLAEEFIELRGYHSVSSTFERGSAVAVLIYTDSTCWELYTTLEGVVDTVFEHASMRLDMAPVRASLESRGQAFGDAGIGRVWRAIRGRA